ncbi:MAG: ClpX C4-type zinc finger protein [Myxococcaceae bacterium]
MADDVRDYLRAAQQAEVQGDKRRAVELLERVVKLYTTAGNPTRALSVLRHARRLDSAVSSLESSPQASFADVFPGVVLDSFHKIDTAQERDDVDTDIRRDDPLALPGNREKKLIDRGPQRAASGLQAWCSFCCRPRAEVGDLVAGAAGVFVCAGCTEEAAALLRHGPVDAPAQLRAVSVTPPGQRETRGAARAPAIPREAVRLAPKASTPFTTDLDDSTELDTATRMERFTEEAANAEDETLRPVALADSADPAPAGMVPRPVPASFGERALAKAKGSGAHSEPRSLPPEPETLAAMTAAVLMEAEPAAAPLEGLDLVGQTAASALVERGLETDARAIAVFGPAGTGKTTYLKALARAGKGKYVLASNLRSIPSSDARLLIDGFEALTSDQARRLLSILGARAFVLAVRARPLSPGPVFAKDDHDLTVYSSQALIDATVGRLPQNLAQHLSIVAQFETPDLREVARNLVEARHGELTLGEDSLAALASEAARSPVCGHELLALINRFPPGSWTLKSAPAPKKKRTRNKNET